MAIWGTPDFSTSFFKLKTQAGVTPYRGTMACIKNIIVLAYTTGATTETNIDYIKSTDGGATWSAPATLIDATSSGTNPTYTIGSLQLAASASGDLTLGYSLVSGNTHHGAFIKEFY